jgi:iron complex outermembrane receptor protein
MWNGVPMNNAMLGLADISNVPVEGFDQLTLDFGSDAIIYGSSSIGGNIRMANRLSQEVGLLYRAQFSTGSFGTKQIHVRSDWNNEKWSTSTRLGTAYSANNFHIDVLDAKQTNSAVARSYLMHSAGWRPSMRTYLKIDYWRQQANREVPPTIRQNSSTAYQKDAADRMVLSLEQFIKSWKLKGWMAYMRESLDYYDPQIRLSSPSSILTQYAKTTAETNAGNWHWLIGVEARKHKAVSDGYSEDFAIQSYQAMYTKISYKLRQWRMTASGRQGRFLDQWIPLIPALEISRGNSNQQMHASIGGHYRIPSLNELFWTRGGNSDLVPEQGWSAELGANQIFSRNEQWKSSIRANLFYRELDNWLQWTLPEEGNFFQALNIDRIISYGLEAHWKTQYTRKDLTADFLFSYTWVRTYSEKELLAPKRAAGQQLHYLPRHRGVATFNLTYYNWRLTYNQQYQSAMDGFNKRIENYQLGDMMLGHHFLWDEQYSSTFQFELRNIWNKSYESVEFRPMPGRHYFLTMIFTLKS